MKAFELNFDELGEITKAIEMLAKSEYIKAIENEMIERLEGKDALMFMAGWHFGSTVACIKPTEPAIAASASVSACKLASETDAEGKDFNEAFNEFADKLAKWLVERVYEECDCPKCRAKREAKGE